MLKIISVLCILIAGLSSLNNPIVAHETSFEPPSATLLPVNEQMEKELGYIEMLFQEFFLSADWVKKIHDVSVHSLFQNLRLDMALNPAYTVKDFRHRLRKLTNSLADWHTGFLFHSTEAALLPFTLIEAENRYFVYESDPYLHKVLGSLPLYPGDEITHWNDIPIQTLMELFYKEEFPLCSSPYAWRHATYYLTTRVGEYGQTMPQESDVKITFIRKGESQPEETVFTWLYLEEGIQTRSLSKRSEASSSAIKKALLEKSQMRAPFHEMICKNRCILEKIKDRIPQLGHDFVEESEDQYDDWLESAARHPLPPLGKVTWKSQPQDLFFGRITKLNNGKKVAYIRIPTFSYGESSQQEKHAKKFAELAGYFNKHSDLMVIDQRMNGGGSLLYLYSLIRPLITKPIDTPKFIERLNHGDISLALNIVESLQEEIDRDRSLFPDQEDEETLDGYPYNPTLAKQAIGYYTYLINEWNKGVLLTEPHFYLGIDQIQPHSVHRYTKPIYILVDESSLSCGDIFPAIMQDAGRATIIGTTTAGAGGHVVTTSFPNPFGISCLSYAASLIFRPNGELIDGNGVHPDIHYAPTAHDRQSENSDYYEFLKKLLQKKK